MLKLDLLAKTRRTLMPVIIMACAVASQAQPPVAVADGYAAGTTGGAGGVIKEVSSASEFKAACESSEKMVIVVTKDLGNVGAISPKSNKTIIGKNTSAGYTGNLALSSVSNIIIQNLTIKNPSGIGTSDGVEASSECTKIFVTKCTFIDCKDGSFDIKRGSDFVTVSWCRFMYPGISGHNFPNLIGHADNNESQDKGKLHITMHHNWYDKGCASRMPRVRFGTVHVYNNYYGYASTYAIGTGKDCTIKLESSEFNNIKKPWNSMGGGSKLGWEKISMTGSSTQPTYITNSWPLFTPPYQYKVDNVDNVKSIVTDDKSGAGNVMGSVAVRPDAAQSPFLSNLGNEISGSAKVQIFDYSGKMVASMASSDLKSAVINGRLSAGVYLAKTSLSNNRLFNQIVTIK